MGKPNKSVWIYASAMFILAIALILLTTLTQNRSAQDGEGFLISDVFNSTAKQRISMVSEENMQLKDTVEQQKNKIASYEQQIAELNAQKEKTNTMISAVASLYAAYTEKDYEAANEILTKLSKEDADKIMPGLYDNVKKAVDSNLKK